MSSSYVPNGYFKEMEENGRANKNYTQQQTTTLIDGPNEVGIPNVVLKINRYFNQQAVQRDSKTLQAHSISQVQHYEYL